MSGRVIATLTGGQRDGETIEILPPPFTPKAIRMEAPVWLRLLPDGTVEAMKGEGRQKSPGWIAFAVDLYELAAPPEGGIAEYRFDRNTTIHRCRYMLPDKERLCRNEAIEGRKFCPVHEKKRRTGQI